MKSLQEMHNLNVGEILDVFHDIDLRIKILHQNSSLVFLKLNDFLKDYYKKNSIVSVNTTRIFDTITGNHESGLISELDRLFEEIEQYKQKTDNEFTSSQNLYRQLNIQTENLVRHMRNLRQDLITLKFLVINNKVMSDNDIIDPGKTPDWHEAISDIHYSLAGIANDAEKIHVAFNEMYLNSKAFSLNSLKRNAESYEELMSCVSLIRNKDSESKSHIPALKERINSSSQSIGNIITHLQYHDIIRQKIEHIQLSHLKITERLKNACSDELMNQDSEIKSIIADISGLQAAQLILISKEYQNALNVISDNFRNIADDLAVVSTISHEFSYETISSENTMIKILKERLDKSLVFLDEYNSNSFKPALLDLRQRISDIHSKVFHNIVKPIQKVVSGLKINSTESEPAKELSHEHLTIQDQIPALVKDILSNSTLLLFDSDNLQHHSDKFPIYADFEGFYSNLEKEQIRIMVDISKILERLDVENRQLDLVLAENFNIKNEIINRLKEVLGKADYYELFDKVLNVIIEKLNTLNNTLTTYCAETGKTNKVKNLTEIESFYTVKSERLVHQMVISESSDIGIPEACTEDDLELF